MTAGKYDRNCEDYRIHGYSACENCALRSACYGEHVGDLWQSEKDRIALREAFRESEELIKREIMEATND